MTEMRRYERSKSTFDTAAEAWEDLRRRSPLVESFDQVSHRDHTPKKWAWVIEVEAE